MVSQIRGNNQLVFIPRSSNTDALSRPLGVSYRRHLAHLYEPHQEVQRTPVQTNHVIISHHEVDGVYIKSQLGGLAGQMFTVAMTTHPVIILTQTVIFTQP